MPIPFIAIGAAAAKVAGPITIGAVSAVATNTVTNALARDWKEQRDNGRAQQNLPDWVIDFGDTVFNYSPSPLPPNPAQNFLGGQCQGVRYRVTVNVSTVSRVQFGPGDIRTLTGNLETQGTIYGPVRNIEIRGNGVNQASVWLLGKDANNQDTEVNIGGSSSPSAISLQASITGTNIIPLDGALDNCGNINATNTINNYYYNTVNNNTINLPPLPTIELPELPSIHIHKYEPYQLVKPLTILNDPIESPEYEDDNINAIKNTLDIIEAIANAIRNKQDTDLEAILTALGDNRNLIINGTCRFNPDNNCEPGGGGGGDIPITITVPYVREIDGERNIYQSQLQVVGNIGNIIDYLTDSAELALDPIRTETAKKIFAILGGSTFWNFETIEDELYATKQYNPEELLRDTSELAYLIEANNGSITNLESKELKSRSLPSLISALLSVNYIRSGQWKFPTEVPDTIVERDPDTPLPFTVTDITLHDSQDYQQWFMQQFDEIIGNWHQKIEIEDNDLLEEGNQSQTVVLHSIADALTEILTQNITTNIYAKTLINMQARGLMELAATKAESVTSNYALDAITDYLGADIRERKINLPLLIKQPKTDSPGEFNITEFLKEDSKEIVIKEYKGKNNFQFSLMSLLQGAAIIKAALTRKAPGSAEEMLDLIKREIGLVGEDNAESEFNEFIEQVEEGFNVYRPNENKPYGRDYDQRPRLIVSDPIIPEGEE